MAKRKFSINLFDILAVVIFVSIICIGALSYFNKPFLGEKDMLVEIKISNTETIEAVLPNIKLNDPVYYGGTKYPVTQYSYRTEKDANGQLVYLYVVLKGPGTVSGEGSIFNGQRIYINQKAEIRDNYQVQGYVTDFRYEN